jgi:hypothetical protein
LPSQFFLGTLVDGDETKVNGVSVGLADKWVVVPQETALVQAAREPLMCRLKPRQKLMVWLLRCKRHFDQLLNGGVLDGNVLTTEYVLGGAFSLDGLHGLGYALMQMLSVDLLIQPGSTLPMIDLDSILFCIQR